MNFRWTLSHFPLWTIFLFVRLERNSCIVPKGQIFPQKDLLKNIADKTTAIERIRLLARILGTNFPFKIKVSKVSNPPKGHSASIDAAVFPPSIKCLKEKNVNNPKKKISTIYLKYEKFFFMVSLLNLRTFSCESCVHYHIFSWMPS